MKSFEQELEELCVKAGIPLFQKLHTNYEVLIDDAAKLLASWSAIFDQRTERDTRFESASALSKDLAKVFATMSHGSKTDMSNAMAKLMISCYYVSLLYGLEMDQKLEVNLTLFQGHLVEDE